MFKDHFKQGSKEQDPMNWTFLLVKSFKLVSRFLDKSS
jgi:hypothetical protein